MNVINTNIVQKFQNASRDNSYIDIFLITSILKLNTENSIDITKLPDHVFKNILDIYIEEEIYCKPYSPYSSHLSREDKIT